MGKQTERVYPQAMHVANWFALATLTASAYVQLTPSNGERQKGVWVYNNCVSSTGFAYLFRDAAPSLDLLTMVVEARTAGNPRSIVFIPGTGAVFAKSGTAGILANLVAVEF